MYLRLARIWPLHFLMLLLFLAMELSRYVVQIGPAGAPFAPPREIGSFFVNMLLLQVYGIYPSMTWNIPSWSIAAEFWVYLIAATMFLALRRTRIPVMIVTAVCCSLFMLISGPPYLNLTYDGSVARCLYGFCIGSVAFSVYRWISDTFAYTHSVYQVILFTIAEIVIILATLFLVTLSGTGPETIKTPLVFALAILILAMQRGMLVRALNQRILVWIGSISYSIYLTHLFVMGRVLDAYAALGGLFGKTLVMRTVSDGVATRTLVGSELLVDLLTLFLLAVIVAFSHLTYNFVEKPCNAWARRALKGAHIGKVRVQELGRTASDTRT